MKLILQLFLSIYWGIRGLVFLFSLEDGGLNVGLKPSIPISTASSPADFCHAWVSSRHRRNVWGGYSFSLNIPVVNRALLHWVIAVPCGINNTGGSYCPCAGHSIIQLKQVEGGGGPFTQPSRVSGPADSGLTLGSLLLCLCTGLHCKCAWLRDKCVWTVTACTVLLARPHQ